VFIGIYTSQYVKKTAKTKINPRPLTGLEKITQRERGKGEGMEWG
jgi:hypothetical protein